MKSTDDRRVENTVMRHEYRGLTEEEKREVQAVKDLGLILIEKLGCLSVNGSRELSLAKTKVEEAVMWAVKHITK